MKIVYWLLGVLIGIPLLFFIAMYGASELGGEVVTLDRAEEDGSVSQVRIWIVDSDGSSLIEHGDPSAHWITRLAQTPEIALSRDGEASLYAGFADPESHDLYHQLRREKYGWADQVIGTLMGDAECQSVPVRLQNKS